MMGVCQPAANRWNDPMTITAPPSTLQRTSYADGKILLDIGEGIATIRFNHPDKHNAMSVEMWEGLGVALKVARDDDSVLHLGRRHQPVRPHHGHARTTQGNR
jgi:hypothetical protein